MSAQRLFPVALAAALAVVGLVASADGPDDIAFRRVALRPEQLAAELERARLDVWRQMPLDQFDDLARRAAAPLPERPRLLETRYRARLDDESLVGSAMWTIRHVSDTPALLSVDPLQVAVRRAAWDGGRPATFGNLDPRPQSAGVELLVDRAGDRMLALDWSARGVPEPAGLRFDLRLPACPLAGLELELPDDVEPSIARDGAVLTGPWPATSGVRLWRVAFGPSTQLDLTLRRRAQSADAVPIVLARHRNRQELTLASVSCEYVLDYEVARGAITELVLECDAGLRPTEVTARNLRGWTAGVGLTPGATRVVVTLTEPTLGGVLTVRGTCGVPAEAAWTSPAVRVVGGVSRGEALTLRIHPDLRLADWRGGGFRIADAAVGADGVHMLQLQSVAGRGDGVRPSVRVVAGGPDYTVRERLWWQVGAERTMLTAELTLAVARGVVERVPLALPAGWTVDRVEFARPDAGAAFVVSPDRTTLTLTWPRGLAAGDALTATVVLARQTPKSDALPFPDLVPLAARGREGVLVLRVDPDLESTTRGPAALPPDAELAADAPWADIATPTAAYALPRAAVEGVLQVAPVRPAHTTAAVTRVTVAGRGVRVEHELRIEPVAGAPDAIVLYVPAAGREPWGWQVVRGGNRVRSVARWPAGPPPISWLAAASTWDAVALAGTRDPAAWWRIALERPLTEAVELKATLDLTLPAQPADLVAGAAAPLATAGGLSALVAAGAAPAAGASWGVPLVRTPAAQREVRDIDITLRSPAWDVRATDATELAIPDSSPGRRRFRADGPAARVEFVRATDERGTVDGARIESSLREDGGFDHELTFRLWDWPAAEVAVGLPSGVAVRSATVDGHATRPECGNDAKWRLPVPFGRRVSTVTVRFTTDAGPWLFWTRLAAPVVELPRGAGLASTAWHFPPGVAALDGGVNSPVVVRPRSWSLAGFVVAVMCYFAVRSAKRSWPLVAALAAAAAAVVVAPPAVADAVRWPLYALVLAAVATVIPRRAVAPVPLAAVALAAWLGVPGRAAAPSMPTVYLVPDAGGTEPRTVLAPPDLLDRLISRARAASAPAFVLPVEAAYEGRIDGAGAQFQATLAVEANADGSLSLPFAGALLRGAKLDGVTTFPRTSGDRLIFAVTGRGRHRLELDFAVPCPEGGERELRFAVAETPTCSLNLRLPSSARYVQTAGRRGAQRLTDEVGTRRLEVDLGRVGAATVRWRQDTPNPVPATVAVREAYLWDLHPTWAKLLGALRYTVGAGVAALAVDIPPGLEVTAVSARPLDAPAVAGASPWLRGWHVAKIDGSRRLQIGFSAPVTGNWVVLLELIPEQPFAPTFALAVPSAVGATAAAPTVLAWRATDFAPQAARVQGWATIPTDDFLRETWIPARVEPDPRPPVRAFRRALAGMPVLLRLMVPAAEPATADVLASWRVAPRRADGTWSLRLSAAGKVALVECDVPVAVELADVAGPEVFAWTRTGTRVQVWLRRPVESAELTLTGSVTRRAEAARFEAPAMRPVGATVSGTLRVAAADGLALTPVTVQQLEAMPDTGRGGREWEYRFRQAAVRAAFQVRSAVGTSDFRADTSVTWADDRPIATTSVLVRVRRGELRSFTVTAARTEGWEFALDAPGSEQVRELTATDRRRAWVIDLPPGVTAEYRVTVTARGPAGVREWTVPDVSVRVPDLRISRFERFVALAGPGWRVVSSDRLAALSSRVWQATHDEARLVVARASDGAAESRIVVASEEVALARTAEGRWLARARYRLDNGGRGELRVSWSQPVRLVAAVRDGLTLPLPAEATRDYIVRLPGGGDGCQLGLTWEAATNGQWPTAVAGPTLVADGSVAFGRRSAVIVPTPGASVEADGERIGSLSVSAGMSAAPFDSLFDGAANAVHFRPLAGWPLRLDWSSPRPRWPLAAAKLLGVALLLGLACVIAWRPRGPVWPFAFLLLGAGLAIVDNPWLGLVTATVGATAGVTLALSDRTRQRPRSDDAVEAEVAADGV